jgi:HlyD family secretion protein
VIIMRRIAVLLGGTEGAGRRVILLLIVFAGAVALPSLPLSLSSVLSPLLSVLPSSFSTSADVPAFRTAVVERGDVVATVQAAGTLNALVQVEVGSQISGQVKELYADFNSLVTEGQVIARVEPEKYEAKVAQAQAELEMAETLVPVQRAQIERNRAELEEATAALASAKAQTMLAELALDDAARDLERKRSLAQRDVVAPGEWERIQNAHRSAQAQVTNSRAQELSQAAAIRAAEAIVKMAEKQLTNTLAQVKQKEAALRQARIDLDSTYIRAPVNGTVINRAVSTGQTVAASLQTPTLFKIAQDLTQMQVEASVVEADVSRFEIGQSAAFTVDAYPDRPFTGTVKQIRKAPQIVQNVVTYVVVIAAENPGEVLLPGMTANLQVVVARREKVLRVPNITLRFRPTGQVIPAGQVVEEERRARVEAAESRADEPGSSGRVFVPGREGLPILIPLRLGITDGRMTEVLAGDLTEGQLIITGAAVGPEEGTDRASSLLKFRLR